MIVWLANWIACFFAGLMGHGWKTPKRWDEEARERRMVQKQCQMEIDSLERFLKANRDKVSLASVPPVAYHRDTPAKEPVMTMPQQDAFPPKTIPNMDTLPNPTSPIYLFVVVTNENDDYQVVRSSSEDPYIPNLQSNELVQDANDFGTYSTEGRARAVAKKLNDEERARRFA